MKHDFSNSKIKGIHKVTKSKERIPVSSLWSIEVPAGYSYCVDPEKTATDVEGTHYLLQIQKTADCDFTESYPSEVNVTVRDKFYIVNKYSSDATDLLDEFKELTEQLSLGSAEVIRAEKDILIGFGEASLFSSYMFFVLIGGTNMLFHAQVTFSGDTSAETDKIARQFADSVQPITVNDFAETTELQRLNRSYFPNFENAKYIDVDGAFKIPVPAGFEGKASEDGNWQMVITPKGFDISGNITDAKLALAIQSGVYDFKGKGYTPTEMITGVINNLHGQSPVQWFGAGVYTDRSSAKGLIVNGYVTTNACDANLNPVLICTGEKVYFGYLTMHYSGAISDDADTKWDNRVITSAWLSQILFKGEKAGSRKAKSEEKEFKIVFPDKSLYPHYDHMMNAGPSLPGVTVIVNQNGTEYVFHELSKAFDYDDEDFSKETKDLFKRILAQDKTGSDLYIKAGEMAKTFRVDASAFDMQHDREAELVNGYMKRAYMMSALRSFAWTVSDYCSKKKKQPGALSAKELKDIIDFIAKRKWLNYDEKTYCKGLCSGGDLHVYFVPDSVSDADRAELLPSQEDLDRVNKMKAISPAYNEILSEVHSLDALRDDLGYIYPAVRTLCDELAKKRDTSKQLEGNEADIVYAWCALALAAREPFLSEDGPMNYHLSQPSDEDYASMTAKHFAEDEDDNGAETQTEESDIIDTLRIGESYNPAFLQEHGKDIKRIIASGYGYVNYIELASCPNVEEFIVGKNSSFSFVDGVLYSTSGGKRTIEYVTKNVKHLYIDADVTDVSSYWHGVDTVTVDPGNSTFVVQDDMLLSRRKNTLYFVTSKAEEVIIPEGVTQIHARAFQYSENLRKVVFPASYEWRGWHNPSASPILITHDNMKDAEIVINGDKASYKSGMIVIPMGSSPQPVLYLGDKNLCHIPSNITSTFGFGEAFAYVENFEVSKDNPAFSSVDGVILDKSGQTLKFYPRTRTEFSIPASVKNIESHSVANCNELTEIVIPENVEEIGLMAFANCDRLAKVTTLNPNTDTKKDAYFGCHLLNGDSFFEPVDEEELKKSVAEELKAIREADKPKKKARKSKTAQNGGPKQTYQYNDNLTLYISDEYKITKSTNDEGIPITNLSWGEYKNEDTGETEYMFKAGMAELPVNPDSDGNIPDENWIIDRFAEEGPGGLTSRSYVRYGDHPYVFFTAENPVEVPMGFFGTIVLKNYILNFGVADGDKVVGIFADGYKNENDEDANEKEAVLYENLLEIVSGIRINGEPIDLDGLDVEKLRNEIEPLFSDVNDTFSISFGEPEEEIPEVRFADDDSRKVIVDNKWSFTLPKGLELRFDSEHVDIMGDSTTAKYVVEGLEHNGRFFFDFELQPRYDDGISKDADVLGCRHDNDVISGNASQKIIKDDDELFVDVVSKPVFFFNSMAAIRVRGEDLRSWDFTAGLKSMDQDMSDRWEEVQNLMKELAGSIQLLDGLKKSSKKKAKKKEETVSDPDFLITNGVLRKYIGKKNDIVIPDGVKEIADSTFSGFSKLKSVVVPEGVKRIGRRCFENCTSLEHAYLPDSLEELGGYAFVDCHELKEVYLSEKLKVLGDSAFSECFKLKDVKIPKNIDIIDAFVFKNCREFRHIVIPDKVKKIGFSAFVACTNLEYLFVPESVKECQINITSHPFEASEKLTIYTPAGSYMQKFAEENNIPYKNADKGTVTADNSSAKSKASTSKPAAGAAGTRTASGFSRQAGFRGSSSWTFPTADTSKVKTKLLSNKKGYAAGFIPTDVILKDPSRDKDSFIYILETEKYYDKFDKTVNLANRCCENVMTPEEADEIKRGLLRTTAPIHALRSLVWTAINMNGGRIEDFIASAPDEMWLEMAQFIYGKGYVNYRPIDARGMGYGYALVRGEEVRSLYTYSREIYNPAEYYYDSDLGRTMTNASHLIVFDMVDILVDFIPAIEALLNGYDDSDDSKNIAIRQILIGWAAYAYACRCTFNVIPGDRISNKIIDADRSSWVDGVEIRELENGRFRAIGTELFAINDRRDTLVIPEGITDFYQPYLRNKSIRDDVEHAKKIIYPKSFSGTVLVPKYASEIELRGNFDDLNFTFGGGYYYSPDSANYDLHSIILLGRIKTVNFYNINNCKNVRELVLPEGLEELNAGAIDFDQHVTVTLPESLKRADESAFGWSYKKPKRKLIVYSTCPVLPVIRKIKDINPNMELSVIDPPWPSISRIFVNRIKPLYRSDDTDNLYASVDTIVKDAFSDSNIVPNCRKAIANEAAKADLPGLRTIMLSEYGDDEFCEKAATLISEDIVKSIEEEKQRKYDEAVSLSSGEQLTELAKAESMFSELGGFKDSKDLLKQVSARLEAKKSAQYDEAVSLFNEGSEDAVIRAKEKLDELGQYKDAQTLSKEYWAYLNKERDYKSALEGIEKNELIDLRAAKEKLEGLAGFKDSDEMLMSCSSKLEAIMSKMYGEALSLAEQQTEESLTEARAIMSRLKPYRDTEIKIEELNDLIPKEKTYQAAIKEMAGDNLVALKAAKEMFSAIEDYKDSAERASECEKEAETFCKYNYVKARKAEKVFSVESQREAISLYRELEGYDDSNDRLQTCQKNTDLIKEILTLERTLSGAKEAASKIRNASARKVYEEYISKATKELDVKKQQLAAAVGVESVVVSCAGLLDNEQIKIENDADKIQKNLETASDRNYKLPLGRRVASVICLLGGIAAFIFEIFWYGAFKTLAAEDQSLATYMVLVLPAFLTILLLLGWIVLRKEASDERRKRVGSISLICTVCTGIMFAYFCIRYGKSIGLYLILQVIVGISFVTAIGFFVLWIRMKKKRK